MQVRNPTSLTEQVSALIKRKKQKYHLSEYDIPTEEFINDLVNDEQIPYAVSVELKAAYEVIKRENKKINAFIFECTSKVAELRQVPS